MPATDDQLRAIAYLAVACRPHGATHWDADGVVANLAKVRDRSVGSLTIAAIQAAEDRNAATPGVIPRPGPHWRAPDAAPIGRSHIEASEHCVSCGGPKHGPIPGDDHEYVSVARARGGGRPPEAAHLIATDLKSKIRPLGDRPSAEETGASA